MPETVTKTNRTASALRRIRFGDIPLEALYHENAVISDQRESHLLITEGWRDGEEPCALAIACDELGQPLAGASEEPFGHVPATALIGPATPLPWDGAVHLLRSHHPGIPSGLVSTDPALLLIPFGPHTGRILGELSPTELTAVAAQSQSPKFTAAISKVKPLVNARFPLPSFVGRRLTEEEKIQLRKDGYHLVSRIPLENVIEDYCGYAPDEITGRNRKYKIGAEILNLDVEKQVYGSLNHFAFPSLDNKLGGGHNAIKFVAAIKDMEGSGVDLLAIKKGLIDHFNLRPQLDNMYRDAVLRTNRRVNGTTSKPMVEALPLKAVATIKGEEPAEIAFNLTTGLPVTASPEEVAAARAKGGGFPCRGDLWPVARRFLVEDRGLAPKLVDHLYEHKNLYASRRSFPSDPRFPFQEKFEDVLVAPVFGFKTGEIVGVDTKTIPQSPREKPEGRNHGKTSQGAFMLGKWGPDTKRVILTEGFIKAIAFLQLHQEKLQLGGETCILARSGAQPTLNIIPQLKANGASAIVAFDNDFVGRSKAQVFQTECEKQFVPCEAMFVENGEVTVTIEQKPTEGYHDQKRALLIEEGIIQWASKEQLRWAYDKDKCTDTKKALRLPNTEKVIYHMEEILKEDRHLSSRKYQAQAKGLSEFESRNIIKERWVRLQLHGKDWDDLLKPEKLLPQLVGPGPRSPATLDSPALPPAKPEVVLATASPETSAQKKMAAIPLDNLGPEKIDVYPPRNGHVKAEPSNSSTGVATTRGYITYRRSAEGKVIYSLGTAAALHDLILTPEQEAVGSMLPGQRDLGMRAAWAKLEPVLELTGVADSNGEFFPIQEIFASRPKLVRSASQFENKWLRSLDPWILTARARLRREQPGPGVDLPQNLVKSFSPEVAGIT